MIPPKPKPRPDRVSTSHYLRLFRRDILSSQPARLYRAWMAEFRSPFFRSFMINQPDLIRQVLQDRPRDFPKSDRVAEGLRPLLGNSVFVTNGETWERQRRIIDPAFEGGRIKDTFPAMWAAADAAVARMGKTDGKQEIEEQTSFAAADVIFRTLFSVPIEDDTATAVFHAFRAYQRTQPVLNLAAFIPLPRWFPRPFRRATRQSAREIRRLITDMTAKRMAQIQAGTAPDDLATKIMTTPDPITGARFDTDEMVDQVAIFFLAGHETSASALAWALYLMALYPDWQDQVAAEGAQLTGQFSQLSKLRVTRDVFRETLRLYPPVPMMVRQAQKAQNWRDRDVKPGAQVVISPWHLHRHERIWNNPDGFDPTRWQREKESIREAYIPFSAGPRVCTGASFAMAEGVLLLARLCAAYRFELASEAPASEAPSEAASEAPIPVAHLTVRAKEGIWLRLSKREPKSV